MNQPDSPVAGIPSRPYGLRPVGGLLAALALSACSTVSKYREPRVDFNAPPPVPVAVAAPAPAAGAIFNAGAYRPLFEDHRARRPGDSIIIAIVERISASLKSTSSVERSAALKAGVTALPGLLPSAGSLARANAAGNSSNTHDGKGSTEASNEFQGTITAVVTGVLPNGHLLIQGEKQIGLNANVDVLRLQRP